MPYKPIINNVEYIKIFFASLPHLCKFVKQFRGVLHYRLAHSQQPPPTTPKHFKIILLKKCDKKFSNIFK